MELYPTITVITWIVLKMLASATGEKDSNITTIWCMNDDIRKNPNLIKGIKKEDMSCTAETTTRYPFTTGNKGRTAPKPRDIKTEVKTYKTMDVNQTIQIAVIVTWTYKVQDLDLAKNYHMELNRFIPFGSAKQYFMNWKKNETLTVRGTSGLVRFAFIYCGKPGDYHIHPKDEYSFKVQACPIYHEDQEPQTVKETIEIPSCSNKKISKTQLCVRKRREERDDRKRRQEKKLRKKLMQFTTVQPGIDTSTSPVQEEELGSLTMVLLMFGGAALVLGMLGVMWCFRDQMKSCFAKLKSQGGQQSQKHVVFICSTKPAFLKPINQFINLFTKFSEVEITCNLRQKNEIGQLGIPFWLKNNVSTADVIVFLIADTDELGLSNDKVDDDEDDGSVSQVSIAFKATEKMIFASKSEYDHKNFIVIDMKNCTKKEDLAYFSRFKLPRDFDKFAKLLIGDVKRIDTRSKNIFLHSLEIAKLGGYLGENRDCEEEPDIRVGLENLNNLDDPSLIMDDRQQELVLEEEGCEQNIVYESQPPSVESNRNESCVTTDFNDNQAERYHRAGARPKVRAS